MNETNLEENSQKKKQKTKSKFYQSRRNHTISYSLTVISRVVASYRQVYLPKLLSNKIKTTCLNNMIKTERENSI